MVSRLIPIPTAAKLVGVSKPTIYRLLQNHKLTAVHVGARTMIPHDVLVTYLASLPAYQPNARVSPNKGKRRKAPSIEQAAA